MVLNRMGISPHKRENEKVVWNQKISDHLKLFCDYSHSVPANEY